MSRVDVIKTLKELWRETNDPWYEEVYNMAIKALEAVPSADRPQGEWIPCTKRGLPLTEMMRREGQKWYGYKCSNCNHIYKGNALTDCNYCPNCGAKMKGADDE